MIFCYVSVALTAKRSADLVRGYAVTTQRIISPRTQNHGRAFVEDNGGDNNVKPRSSKGGSIASPIEKVNVRQDHLNVGSTFALSREGSSVLSESTPITLSATIELSASPKHDKSSLLSTIPARQSPADNLVLQVAKRSSLFVLTLLAGWGFAAVASIYELIFGKALSKVSYVINLNLTPVHDIWM
jgi:hypothetical protein